MQDLLHRGGAPRRPARGAAGRHVLLAVAALALIIAASGCLAKSGTYAPIDWAAEMHYTQTYRPQEPPRLDSPPGAVPFKFADDARALTREPHYDAEDYATLTNPREGEAGSAPGAGVPPPSSSAGTAPTATAWRAQAMAALQRSLTPTTTCPCPT